MAKKPTHQSEYSREREFTVILADLRSQFRVFGEGQQILTRKVEDLTLRVGGLENRMDVLENRVGVLSNQVSEMKTSLDRFFSVLSDHEGRITTLEAPR